VAGFELLSTADLLTYIGLPLVGVATSTVSGTVGVFGGTLLLSAMTQVFAPSVVIPLHGTIQFGSNISRAWFLRSDIDRLIFSRFALGTVAGSLLAATAASQFLKSIDQAVYSIGLGVFMIAVTLWPKRQQVTPPSTPPTAGSVELTKSAQLRWIGAGFFISWLGLLVGAVGTVFAALIVNEPLNKKAMVATQAACQTLLHFAKVSVFLVLGFTLWQWKTFLFLMLLATVVGSYLGTRLLHRIPEAFFKTLLRGLIVVLSLRLIWSGIWGA
jgi:uncharacterized protein